MRFFSGERQMLSLLFLMNEMQNCKKVEKRPEIVKY